MTQYEVWCKTCGWLKSKKIFLSNHEADIAWPVGIRKPDARLIKITGTPYRCSQCKKIPIATYGRGIAPGNCNREECECDVVEQCGPRQKITIVLWSAKR